MIWLISTGARAYALDVRNLQLTCLVLCVACAASTAQDVYVPGQLLIRLDPALTDAEQAEIIATFGVRTRAHLDLLRVFWVDCPATWDVEKKGAQLAADPRVEYAIPNYYGRRVGTGGPVTPSDPQFGNSWGLNNTGQFINGVWAPGAGVADADVDAPEAGLRVLTRTESMRNKELSATCSSQLGRQRTGM